MGSQLNSSVHPPDAACREGGEGGGDKEIWVLLCYNLPQNDNEARVCTHANMRYAKVNDKLNSNYAIRIILIRYINRC